MKQPLSNFSEVPRSSGILLHPTSLPGGQGIGDLGPAARRFLDQLAAARQSWWQMLPLGPSGDEDSPYKSFSAFAGNPLLISGELLASEGLVNRRSLAARELSPDRVDFGSVERWKQSLLAEAWESFGAGKAKSLRDAFGAFCRTESRWLDDYALFMAIREAHGCQHWCNWPEELVCREPAALRSAWRELADSIGRHRFGQFLFYRQLDALRAYAAERGIGFIGDVPIFVSDDSADVWANPHLFLLDRQRRPRVVAGVPPDFFSASGQRWGNPLYDWKQMAAEKFDWWIRRFKAVSRQFDLARIDHFRGFAACWQIPASAPDARKGRWVAAPGKALFAAVTKRLAGLPFIAEDLGLITPDVEALRQELKLPGMRVLQFAFGGDPSNNHLTHHHVTECVAYSGTHDNNTTRGWFGALGSAERKFLAKYVNADEQTVAWELIREAWGSVARLSIAPLQDVLNLGSDARMNTPGQATGNWRWRYREPAIKESLLERLGELSDTYDRVPRNES